VTDADWDSFLHDLVREAGRGPRPPGGLGVLDRRGLRGLLPVAALASIAPMVLRGRKMAERHQMLHDRYAALAGVDRNTAYLRVESMLRQLSFPTVHATGESQPAPTEDQLTEMARAISRYLGDGPDAVDKDVRDAEEAWDRVQEMFGPLAGPDAWRDGMPAFLEFTAAWRRWWDRQRT
jgi:hypothetical protein